MDNFFRNPAKIVDLADRQIYYRSEVFPGERTLNLLEQKHTKEFGLYFANKLIKDVFPALDKFRIDLRFHKNYSYEDDELNLGWIHSDGCDLAGLVYLTPKERNLSTGTSIYDKKQNTSFVTTDISSRTRFNLSGIADENYKTELRENHQLFEETIRYANKFNRLIAYDADMFHKPNTYKTVCGDTRLTLLFFLNDCMIKEISGPNLKNDWIDL